MKEYLIKNQSMNKDEEKEIIDLLNKYVNNNMDVDDDFINDIINIVKYNRKLSDYINEVIIRNNPKDEVFGFYDEYGKIIQINDIVKTNNKNVNLLNVIRILLHECEHVSQTKLCDSDSNTLERMLLKYSFKINDYINILDDTINDKKTKIVDEDDIYGLLPSERQAEINSLRNISRILINNDNELIKPLALEYYEKYKHSLLDGYNINKNKIISPTYKLVEKMNAILKEDEASDILYYLDFVNSSLSTYDKMYYGLNITHSEMHKYLGKIKKM